MINWLEITFETKFDRENFYIFHNIRDKSFDIIYYFEYCKCWTSIFWGEDNDGKTDEDKMRKEFTHYSEINLPRDESS